jgi:hypothetical protein
MCGLAGSVVLVDVVLAHLALWSRILATMERRFRIRLVVAGIGDAGFCGARIGSFSLARRSLGCIKMDDGIAEPGYRTLRVS